MLANRHEDGGQDQAADKLAKAVYYGRYSRVWRPDLQTCCGPPVWSPYSLLFFRSSKGSPASMATLSASFFPSSLNAQ